MLYAKRILLLIILSSILLASMLYVAFTPKQEKQTLRLDTIPSLAYIVPWMTPSPSVENIDYYSKNSQPWDIDSVMTGSLKISANFRINLTNETRIVPSTIYLGHDSQCLYVGAALHGIYRNPTNTNPMQASPHIFALMFDVNNNGSLTFPEAGSLVGVAVFKNASLYSNQEVWGYNDLLWSNRSNTGWQTDAEFFSPKASPGYSVKSFTAEYDNVTGTLTILYSRLLLDPTTSSYNYLQIRTGERRVMGFMLMAGYTQSSTLFQSLVVSCPQGYSYESNDSSWWPKLAIDLSNPPTTYPSNTSM